MKQGEEDFSILQSNDFSQKNKKELSTFSTIQTYYQILMLDIKTPPNLIYSNPFSPETIRKFQHKKIIYNENNHFSQIKIEIIQASINKQVLLLKVLYGRFIQYLSLININNKNIHFLISSKLSDKMRDNIVEFQFFKEIVTIKAFPYKPKNFCQRLTEAIKQIFLLRIASVLQTGPNLKNYFGFDILIYQDSIEFGMEYSPIILDFNQSIMRNDLITALKINHSFNLIHQDIKIDNIGYSKIYQKYIFIDYGYSNIIIEQLGNRTMVGFKGTLNFCSEEMKKCYISQKKDYVDLYHNDAHCLKSVFQLMEIDQSYRKISSESEHQSYKNNLTLLYIIYPVKYILFFSLVSQKALQFLQNYKAIIKSPWLYQLIKFQKIIQPIEQYHFFWKYLLSKSQPQEQVFSFSKTLEGFDLQYLTQLSFQNRFNDFINELAKISFNSIGSSEQLITINCPNQSNISVESLKNTIINTNFLLKCSQILDITNGQIKFEEKYSISSQFLLKHNKSIQKQKKQIINQSLMILYEYCYKRDIQFSIRLKIIKNILSSVVLLDLIKEQELLRAISYFFNIQNSLKQKLSLFLIFIKSKVWIDSLLYSFICAQVIENALFIQLIPFLQNCQPKTQQEVFLLQILNKFLWFKQNIKRLQLFQLYKWYNELIKWKMIQLYKFQMKFDCGLSLEYFQLIEWLLCQILTNLKKINTTFLLRLYNNNNLVKNRQKNRPYYYYTSIFKGLIFNNQYNMAFEILSIFRVIFSPYKLFDKFYIATQINSLPFSKQLFLNNNSHLHSKIDTFSFYIQSAHFNYKFILFKNLMDFMILNKISKQIQKQMFIRFVFKNNFLIQYLNLQIRNQSAYSVFHTHFLLTICQLFVQILIQYTQQPTQLKLYLIQLQNLIKQTKCYVCKFLGKKYLIQLYYFFLIFQEEIQKAFEVLFLDMIYKMRSNQSPQAIQSMINLINLLTNNAILSKRYDIYPFFNQYLQKSNQFGIILINKDMFLSLYLQFFYRKCYQDLYQFVIQIFTFLQKYSSYSIFVSNNLLSISEYQNKRGITLQTICQVQLDICYQIIKSTRKIIGNKEQSKGKRMRNKRQSTDKHINQQYSYKLLNQIYKRVPAKTIQNPFFSIYFYYSVFLVYYYFPNHSPNIPPKNKIVSLLKIIALLLSQLEFKDRIIIKQSYFLIVGNYLAQCQRHKTFLSNKHLRWNFDKKSKKQLICFRLMSNNKNRQQIDKNQKYINFFKQKFSLYYTNLQKITNNLT